jgi:type II secretory ATPase GspE/PulE/Tfp pilus assembly ATPase PilB-like protein
VPDSSAVLHQAGKKVANPPTQVIALHPDQAAALLAERAIVTPGQLAEALDETRMHGREPIRLGDFLLREGLITRKQLQHALQIQAENRGRRLGDILVDIQAVSPRMVQLALSERLGIPYVDVRRFEVEPKVLRAIDPRVALRYQVLPLFEARESLVVAVANPLATGSEQELSFAAGRPIVSVIADPRALQHRIAVEYGAETRPIAPSESTTGDANDRLGGHELNDNALVRLVNKIVIDAHAQGASDIHIESNPLGRATRIRFRRDGEMEDYLELPARFRTSLVSRLKVMAGLDISEHRTGQDGKIRFSRFAPVDVELRVAIIPTQDGLEDVVVRLLGAADTVPLKQLGLGADLADLIAMAERSHGLILVCGPTGSGKTTTLHSVLHHLNRPDCKIWTAEDPIEITQPGLRQVQVNRDTGWTFAAAMRSFLRADPDVIMVGEMRDAETCAIGIEASLTGHLVLSTLHTNSAPESIVRLLELGMEPFNFADALLGVLSQRLVRKLCPHCRRGHAASAAELAELAREYAYGTGLDPVAVLERWRRERGDALTMLYEVSGAGCMHCRGGYQGRVGLFELLRATPAVKNLVRARAPLPRIVAAALDGGMRTLKQDAIEKVLAGTIDPHGARAAAS